MATYEDYCKRRGIPYTPPPKAEPVRAREPDGQFKSDDPATPDVNEAFDPPKKVSKPAAKKKVAKKKVKKK